MSSEYIKEYTISISDCDASGRLRASALLVSTQELAEIHAVTFGLSRRHLLEQGVCWVLYRQHIVMHSHPTFGDNVRLITWPGAIEGPVFPRNYVLETMDGTRIGEIATSWILMDIHTRRPMRPSALPGTVPPNTEREAPLPLPGMLRISDATPVMERTVRYSDLDVNGHMNNTKYIDWICDVLDIATLNQRGLASFQINYISEARPDDTLILATLEDGEKTYVQGKRAADNRPVFDAFVTLG